MTTLDKMLQGLANALGASLSTLTTTAKTIVGAINELKSGLTTANTNISTNTTKIGSGTLNTTAQTIIPAINELASKGSFSTKSVTYGYVSNYYDELGPYTGRGYAVVVFPSAQYYRSVTVDGVTITMQSSNLGTQITVPFFFESSFKVNAYSGYQSSGSCTCYVCLFE